MFACEEDRGDAGQTYRRTHRAGEQQSAPAHAIDHGHRDDGENQIGRPDRYRLRVARDFAEAGAIEDVVEVIKDGVDPRKLSEEPDRDAEEDRQPVLALE